MIRAFAREASSLAAIVKWRMARRLLQKEGAAGRGSLPSAGRVVKLFMVLTMLCLAGVACTPQQIMEAELGMSLNQMRAENGLSPLGPDTELSAVARTRAEDMATKGYFSHQPPDACDFRCLLNKQGISIAWAGEVIAWSNYPLDQAVPMTIGMWRNSPSHFGIITNRCFTRMGTGAAIAPDGRTYHVAVFEGGAPECSP